MSNLAYKYEGLTDDIRKEMLDGKIVAMSPRPSSNHQIIAGNIHSIFKNFLKGKPCRVFMDGPDVHLTEKDRVVPDVFVVCNKDIINKNGIYGAPDLVAEVISPGSAKKDKGYKKDLYEKCGVKEYWLVDASSCLIEVYLLKNNKFELDNIYVIYPDYEIELMTDEEVNEIVHEFNVATIPGLIMPLEEIFEGMV